ncbi:MAG: PIN domain-containing protein [Armatimonadetes bacterium]|nr:PIN domain-containing protein [Armatimonadota bacterium]
MFLVDTSVWVRCLEKDNPLGVDCVRAIKKLKASGEELWTCAQVVIELWAVCSRPREANGLGFDAETIDKIVTDILLIAPHLDEPVDIGPRWRRFAVRYAPSGKPCHDLRLVTLADAYGIDRILTCNASDLKRFTEIKAVHPSEV